MPDQDAVMQLIGRIEDYEYSDAFVGLDPDIRMAVTSNTSALVREFDDARLEGWPDAAVAAWLAKAELFVAKYNIP